jgi:hypothetical protein
MNQDLSAYYDQAQGVLAEGDRFATAQDWPNAKAKYETGCQLLVNVIELEKNGYMRQAKTKIV